MNEMSPYQNNTYITSSNEPIDVYLAEEFINGNCTINAIISPNAQYALPFYQTRDTLLDVERYKHFLDNAISCFRRSRTYKGYKSYLMLLGMNRCQILGNISDDMAEIEMHHNFLTIFDIAILISQHVINTVGKITTFDLVALLKQEHKLNNIPIVMLSKTAHQIYHDNPDFYIPLSMTFGQWWILLNKYRYGITLDIAYKVVRYINNCQKNNELKDLEYFKLRDNIKNWGYYNEYANNTVINNYNSNFSNNGYIDCDWVENNVTSREEEQNNGIQHSTSSGREQIEKFIGSDGDRCIERMDNL